jgi:hypothetical protein
MPPTPSHTYERLRDTIARRMRMSDVVQPLMLTELLGRRSPAPAQDVARRILVGGWWARFTFNGISHCEKGTYALVGGDELSDPEREQLLAAAVPPPHADQRLDQGPGSPMRQGPLRVLRGP